MLRNWFIKKLGGYTKDECSEIRHGFDEWRAEVLSDDQRGLASKEKDFSTQREWFYTVLNNKDEEIKRLTNLMLQEHGVLRPQHEAHSAEKMVPLNKRVSWKEKQEALQKADAKTAADRVKEQWEKKNASQPGTGT